MSLQNLRPNPGSKKKRKVVGRGNASGHGTFSTRGGKGQTARSGGVRAPGFEGGQTPFYRRIPKFRGFKNPGRIEYQIVNVESLEIFENGTKVTGKELFEKKLIDDAKKPVKLLGNGEIKKKLEIEVEKTSKSAVEKIEKAGGGVRTKLYGKEEGTESTK